MKIYRQQVFLLTLNCIVCVAACVGHSHKGKVRTQQTVNVLKNRHSMPAPDNINTGITLNTFLNSNDNPDLLSEDSAATVEGYFVKVKQEKGESCNGYSTNPADWDYHVYIASDSTAHYVSQTMVAEVTPFTRALHPEYTLKYLRMLKGQKVRITGWVMYDFEHLDVSAGAHPHAKKVYRKTVYEIHPITNIEVVSQTPQMQLSP